MNGYIWVIISAFALSAILAALCICLLASKIKNTKKENAQVKQLLEFCFNRNIDVSEEKIREISKDKLDYDKNKLYAVARFFSREIISLKKKIYLKDKEKQELKEALDTTLPKLEKEKADAERYRSIAKDLKTELDEMKKNESGNNTSKAQIDILRYQLQEEKNKNAELLSKISEAEAQNAPATEAQNAPTADNEILKEQLAEAQRLYGVAYEQSERLKDVANKVFYKLVYAQNSDSVEYLSMIMQESIDLLNQELK